MPMICFAFGCDNEQTTFNRLRGISFHRFPRDESMRRQWEQAVLLPGFSAPSSAVLCSEHFNPEDVIRNERVRIRHGAIPRQPPSPVLAIRNTRASRRTREETIPEDVFELANENEPQPVAESEPQPNDEANVQVDDYGHEVAHTLQLEEIHAYVRHQRADSPWEEPNPPTVDHGRRLALVYPELQAIFHVFALSPFVLLTHSDADQGNDYEALLDFEERQGAVVLRRLTREQIKSFPTKRFQSSAEDTCENTTCIICCSDYTNGQKLRTLPCSHDYHAKCIDRWLKSSPTCPHCRADMRDVFE